ncbi:cyclic nucleotide-binding domain-containing protein [Mesoterricola silvestris]|uniref:Crp/Fnr family transcriptional regulator n=1 Tax=Mesoterricola silvestris TaxID=2927979 RepID=A0AA48GQ75_9BACT|nr:cyclic nucleotide-binding domain-containing protein [Mesoterricola silvestris]BDU72180.1 hypothetical protein METEAL_13540 [Mesoterricola silvestris]
MPHSQPTSTQARILRHLRLAEEDGRRPSYRELAGTFGWRAVATVRDHVVAMQRKGLVTLAPRQARSLRLTEAGRAASEAALAKPLPNPDTTLALATAAQEVLDLLAPWLRSRSYAQGAILWHEGDPADRLVSVEGGRLRAFRQLADGRTATVLQFGAGEVLGFAPFFDEGGYPATVEALEATRIRYVIRQDLVSAMREPRIAMALLGLLARRLRKAFDTIEHLSLHRALPRVAAALQGLVKDGAYPLLTLPQPAKAFAEALGLAEATLSRTLAQLVHLGILHRLRPRRYQVLQPEELGRLGSKAAVVDRGQRPRDPKV